MRLVEEAFGGECSKREIGRLREVVERERASVGVGGGKAMDTAKTVGHEAGATWACVPTIASTDTPTSALSVVYTDDGVFEEYMVLPRNPDLVLVDTQLAVNAPVRFLVGDGRCARDRQALRFEARLARATLCSRAAVILWRRNAPQDGPTPETSMSRACARRTPSPGEPHDDRRRGRESRRARRAGLRRAAASGRRIRSVRRVALVPMTILGLALLAAGIVYLTVACQSLPGFMGPVHGDTSPRTGLGILGVALGVAVLAGVLIAVRRQPPTAPSQH